jgi:hypothetical protein
VAKPWWAKVSPDYYKKPSNLSAVVDKRARHYAAVLADTHLRDEPQIAAAFLNANVPYSIAQRVNRQYQIVKDQAANNVLKGAGVPNAATAAQKASGPPATPPPPPGDYWSLDPSNLWDAFVKTNNQIYDAANGWAARTPYVPTLDTAMEGLRTVPKAIMTVPNMAYSAVQVPLAMFLANDAKEDFKTGKAIFDAVDKQIDPGPLPSFTGENRFFGDATTTVLGAAYGPAKAIGQFFGAAPLAPNQQADMRRNGYDPDSFASRYAWYYDAMDAGQRAVSENDVRQLKQEFDPEKVDAVREIITSNFLNDGKPEALSPAAQTFIQGLTENDGKNADPKDSELFDRFNHAAGLRPGGIVSTALGQDVGSEASQVTAALGDLAFYWFADPYAAGVKGLAALKEAQRLDRMVPAGSKAAMENKMVATVDGTVDGKPISRLGSDIDNMLDAVDDVHVILNVANKLADGPAKAKALKQAGQIYGQWTIKHPDMVNQWAFAAQWRAGRAEFIAPKSGADWDAAVAKAEKGEGFEPFFTKYNDKPTKPGYVLDRSSPQALQRSLNESRADIVSRMSEFLFLNAWFQGRPIVKGMIHMPGEVSMNAAVRSMVAPLRDKLVLGDRHILKYLNDPANVGNAVHFNGQLDRIGTLFLGRTSGEWIKANYTQKWLSTAEKIAAKFGYTYSGREIVFSSPDSLKTIMRMGLGHMPRRMAQVVAANYARGGPAERRMMYEQFENMLAEAANFKNTPLARQTYEVLTKGQGPRLMQGSPFSFAPAEAYTAARADNEIAVGESKVAAGIWDYQMSDRATAPNYRMIRAMQQRTGLLSAVTGLFNARILNGPTAVWKVGKVGNPPNMFRQAMEGYALLLADQGFGAFMGALNARRAVANATVEERMEAQQLTSAANKIGTYTQGKPVLQRAINDAHRSGDVVKYRQTLAGIARQAGFSPEEVGALTTLAQGVRVEDLMRLSTWGKTAVALSGAIEPLRKIRLVAAEQIGKKIPGLKAPKDVVVNAAWHQWADQSFIDGLVSYALGRFGHASDDAISLTGGSVAQEIAGGAKLGVKSRPAALPNARDWLGTSGDSGALNWFKELDSRQVDKVGNEVLRAVAIQARNAGPATIADILNASRTTEKIPSHLNDPYEIARWLIKDSANGEGIRNAAYRLSYDEFGGRINDRFAGSGAWDNAVDRLVEVQVRDAALHLGARETNTGSYVFDPAFNPMLDKLGYARQITAKDLSAIPDKVRPKELSASVYVPDLGHNFNKRNFVDWSSKLYSFVVARPLQRLAINPIYLANKNIAYKELGPMAEEFINAGMTPKQTAGLLEQAANNYAVQTTFRYTDNVYERSFFSESTENFLMFQRASEDFLRRFAMVAKASPTILSKSYLLMEAANHSGMIYAGPPEDDDGDGADPKRHLMFTFPGSAMMARTIQEVGRSLGFGDSDLVTTPLYSSMTSQVRYVNPSLSNPFGFSTSPMIGMPLRIMRWYFPETDSEVTNTLARIEGGGERFFAEQSVMQSVLPTPIARLLPALTQDETDGQLASSIRNAFVYFGAAGLVPGDDATSEEKEEAHEAIRDMATNQLVWRALVGTFSPWAPQFNAPQGTGLPEVNVLDHARGIRDLRSEWFEVIHDAAEKVGAEAAMGEASAEWFKRHPDGASILNPNAFLTGTTDNPGNAGHASNVASGPALTEWMIANKDWLKDNETVAYYMLPNYLEAQYTSQGMRDQLRNQVRVHRDGADFYAEMRYQIAMRQYWQMVNRKSALIASGVPKRQVNADFKEWENAWQILHPATFEEKQKREDPQFVKGTLAPALGRMVQSGNAPKGVDVAAAKKVWDWYNAYEAKYNKTPKGSKGQDQRYKLNEYYREQGDAQFLGTPAHDLWKAMDIYENGY